MEYVEPSGLGALQLAFQQLKDRLEAEGLFREDRKTPPPLLPRTVAVVTSPRGAAIHDIFSVIGRRYPNIKLVVVPVAVQGTGAETTIAHALSMVNVNDHADVIILARGGGSLEDLQPYNSEAVARAIAASHIPIVTGIGHETDLTIADLAADLRAPTPSAAAELVVPEKTTLQRMIESQQTLMERAVRTRLASLREVLRYSTSRLVHPGRRVAEFRLRLDDKVSRIHSSCLRQLERHRHRLAVSHHRLRRQALRARLDRLNALLKQTVDSLLHTMLYLSKERRHEMGVLVARLNSLNPLRILERGYSITRRLADGAVLTDVANVDLGSQVAVTLFRGEMVCAVKRKKEHGQANL
jgi:exodeoxyribonuclease VII large subunit